VDEMRRHNSKLVTNFSHEETKHLLTVVSMDYL
jgi:hypothetical protein